MTLSLFKTILLFIKTGTLIFKHKTGIQSFTLSSTEFEYERTEEKSFTLYRFFPLIAIYITVLFYYRVQKKAKTSLRHKTPIYSQKKKDILKLYYFLEGEWLELADLKLGLKWRK